MPSLTFFFELASTYSYLSAARIDDLAREQGVSVQWMPFLLGPIFANQGLTTSPFNLFPAKGTYMWRDIERLCATRGLAFQRPSQQALERFPNHSVLASRVALVGLKEGWGKRFVRAVYEAQFYEWKAIADPAVIGALIEMAGGDPGLAMEQATSPETKTQLRLNTKSAEDAGVFGAPSFLVGEDLYWGDDRLEMALNQVTE